jgi:protein O-mannosyl-transferase
MMNRQRIPSYLAALVALLTFLVYLSALRNDFVIWDDDVYVMNNLHLRSLTPAFFRWAFTDISTAGFWHPLVWISYAFDYAVWGLNPTGYHLTAILLHAVNTFLVVILVLRLIAAAQSAPGHPLPGGEGMPAPPDRRPALIAASVTGILFGLHPLHVESVAWISERKDLLCALFSLLSMMAYTRYAVTRAGAGTHEGAWSFFKNTHYLLSLACFVLALSSKSMAVTLPAVLLLMDWYPFRRDLSRKGIISLLVEKIPFAAMSVLAAVISIAAQKAYGEIPLQETVRFPARVLAAFKALALYLRNMLLPLDLSPLYLYPKEPSFASFEYLAAIMLVAGITAVCFLVVRKRPFLLAAWGYYVVTLLPVLGIIQVGRHFMADRYTYLPGLGPFLLAGLGVARAWEKWGSENPRRAGIRMLGAAAVFAVLLLMVNLTMKQIALWKDSVVFWSHVIERGPGPVPAAYNNRATAYRIKGELSKAIEDYTAFIALDRTSVVAFNNRGIAFREAGQLDRAIEDHTRAIALKPDLPDSYLDRGLAHRDRGQLDLAMADMNRAIDLDKNNADAFVNRGLVFREMGRIDLALEDYTRAITLDPSHAIAYNNRGMALLETGQTGPAVADYTAAIAINPLYAQALTNRGLAFEQAGQIDRAVEDYTAAIKANPSFANAYNNRGLVLERTGRFDRALEDFNTAIVLHPAGVEAYSNRGLVFEDLGQFVRAIEDYDRAIELSPDDYQAYNNRGIAFRKMGQLDKAVNDQNRAIFLKPDFVGAYLERGDCFRKMSKPALAVRDYRKACSLGNQAACEAVLRYAVP